MNQSWPVRQDLESLSLITPLPAVNVEHFRRLLNEGIASHAACDFHWLPRPIEPVCQQTADVVLGTGIGGFSCHDLRIAETLASAGAKEFLLTRPPAVGDGPARLASLAVRAELTVVCDHFAQAELLSAACRHAGSRVNLLISIDVGMWRLGVRPGPDLDDLLRSLRTLRGVSVSGITIANDNPFAGVRELHRDALTNVLRASLRSLEKGGCASPTLSFQRLFDIGSSELREIGFEHVKARTPYSAFGDCPFAVIAGVIGRPTRDLAVIDAGERELAGSLLLPKTPTGTLTLASVCTDHSVLKLEGEALNLLIGDAVPLRTWNAGHADWASSMLANESGVWSLVSLG